GPFLPAGRALQPAARRLHRRPVTPSFPASAMIGLNLVLLLAAGLMLARLLESNGFAETRAAPSWPVTAPGFLLAMALNPAFVPRYPLSAYSETSVPVPLAFAGLFAARLLDRVAARRAVGSDVLLLGLALAALVNIKQESVALAVGMAGASAALALLHRC